MLTDRLSDALRAIVRAELPRLTFLGAYGYTVQRASSGTVDASPASSLGLPDVQGVPLVGSLLGQTVTPQATGAPCTIRFINGDPTRPVCTSIDAPAASATVDATGALSLGPSAASVALAGGTAPVARVGDAVAIFVSGLLIGILTPPGGSPVTIGPMVVTTCLAGIISSGGRATA